MPHEKDAPAHLKNYLDLYYDFWFKLNALYGCWAKKQGLTFNALFVLYVLRKTPGDCTQKTICDNLQLPKQTINAILASFQQKGYIQKEELLTDRRNKRIIFTKAGQIYADKILASLQRLETNALKTMSREQRLILVQTSQSFLINISHQFNQN